MLLNERFYYVDKQGNTLDNNGNPIGKPKPGWKPCYIGYYYNLQSSKDDRDNPNRIVWVKNFDDYNKRDTFEKAVQAKGQLAQLAHKYNIMPTYDTKEARVLTWLSNDSYYNEDSFFYVTDVPGYEGKKVAFQLRLSNHFINPIMWMRSHMKRLYTPNGETKRRNQMAQFALNLMVNRFVKNTYNQEDVKFKDNEEVEMFSKYGITIYECDLNLDKKTPEQMTKIDEFLTKIGKEIPFTISFSDLEFMFGKLPAPRKEGGTEYDPVNFTERPNIKGRKGKPYPYKGEKEQKQPLSIKYDELVDIVTDRGVKKQIGGKEYYLFDYNGEHLAFDEDEMKVYRQCVKKGVPVDKIDMNTEYNITENVMKFTERDIKQMVMECVRKILFV